MILRLRGIRDQIVKSVVVLCDTCKNNLDTCGNSVLVFKFMVEDVVIRRETDGTF